jgi:hypothetical protein
MSQKSALGLFVLCLFCALPATAQLDSYTLRSKLGAPLNRETYHLPQGFDLIVDYGAANQVCKLEVPAEMPRHENASDASDARQRMQDFLLDLVPGSMRGKELNRLIDYAGAASALSVEYEHLTIVENRHAGRSSRGETITVMFKNDDCR